MGLVTFQVIAIGLIFFTGWVGGFLAHRLKGSSRQDLFLSLGNTFGGGIFLGAGIMHTLPDAFDGFSDLYENVDYPIASVICGIGFLSILLLEKVFIPGHEHPGIGHHELALKLYPYVLMLVLSFHSIITGIALGAEQQLAGASVLLIAILVHKGSAAFALGTSLIQNRFRPSLFNRLVVGFALTTPSGIIAGSILTKFLTGPAEQRFEAAFDALAAGTFLYIAALDILSDEFTQPEQRRAKYVMVAFGFAIMAIIAIWT